MSNNDEESIILESTKNASLAMAELINENEYKIFWKKRQQQYDNTIQQFCRISLHNIQ